MRAEVPGFHRATLVHGESGGVFHFVPLRLQAVNYRYLLQANTGEGRKPFLWRRVRQSRTPIMRERYPGNACWIDFNTQLMREFIPLICVGICERPTVDSEIRAKISTSLPTTTYSVISRFESGVAEFESVAIFFH